MNLGSSLYRARKSTGLSQEAVAEKLGVSRQTISKWETDETLPDIRQSKRLAALYKVSLDELIDFDLDVQEVQQAIQRTSDGQNRLDESLGAEVPRPDHLPGAGGPGPLCPAAGPAAGPAQGRARVRGAGRLPGAQGHACPVVAGAQTGVGPAVTGAISVRPPQALPHVPAAGHCVQPMAATVFRRQGACVGASIPLSSCAAELLFQLPFGQLNGHRPAVGAVLHLPAHHKPGHLLQLLPAAAPAALDRRLAGHGV